MQKITFTNPYGKSLTFGGQLPYLLIDGDYSSASITADQSRYISFDGGDTISTNLNARTIILNLAFIGKENKRYSDSAMRGVWENIQATFLPGKKGILILENDLGEFFIDCYPFEMPKPERSTATLNTVTLQMIADYPYWQSVTPTEINLVGGNNTVNNPSNMPVPFTLEIKNINSVTVKNLSTGGEMKSNKALGVGQTLKIDTKECETKLYASDGSFTYADITPQTDYFLLAPGNNVLQVLPFVNGTSTAKLIYHKHYIGVI